MNVWMDVWMDGWMEQNFQHQYSSLQCHMIIHKSVQTQSSKVQ